MPQFNDPFSQVYNGLWALIERNKNLKELIPEGNRIKFNEESIEKSVISSGDTPELAILRGGVVFGVEDTKDYKGLTATYIFALTTGEMMISPLFNPITFEIYRSLVDWCCVLKNLEWCNCIFVDDLRIISSDEGTSMEDLNREIPGWSCLLSVEVKMKFPTLKLKL